MSRALSPALASGLAVATALAFAGEARAGLVVGAEMDAAAPLDAPTARAGFGFFGTLGYRIGLGPVFLQPEAQAGYLSFLTPSANLPAPRATRILGGARLGLGRMVQPTLFGHVGLGWLGAGQEGPALDAGVALGFKLIPYLRFGAQVAYNVVTLPSEGAALRFFSYGVHAGVEL